MPRPVVIFTNSMVMGGMEEHVIQLGRTLVQRGTRVGVICSLHAEIEPMRQQLRDAGVPEFVDDQGTYRLTV